MEITAAQIQSFNGHVRAIALVAIFDPIQRGDAGGIPDLRVSEIDNDGFRILCVIKVLKQIVAAGKKTVARARYNAPTACLRLAAFRHE